MSDVHYRGYEPQEYAPDVFQQYSLGDVPRCGLDQNRRRRHRPPSRVCAGPYVHVEA